VQLSTFLESFLFALHMTTLIVALAAGYAAKTTTIGLAVASIPAVAQLCARLASTITRQSQPRQADQQEVPAQIEPQPAIQEPGVIRTSMQPHPSHILHLTARPKTVQQGSAAVSGDALLFGKARPLSARLKKNS